MYIDESSDNERIVDLYLSLVTLLDYFHFNPVL